MQGKQALGGAAETWCGGCGAVPADCRGDSCFFGLTPRLDVSVSCRVVTKLDLGPVGRLRGLDMTLGAVASVGRSGLALVQSSRILSIVLFFCSDLGLLNSGTAGSSPLDHQVGSPGCAPARQCRVGTIHRTGDRPVCPLLWRRRCCTAAVPVLDRFRTRPPTPAIVEAAARSSGKKEVRVVGGPDVTLAGPVQSKTMPAFSMQTPNGGILSTWTSGTGRETRQPPHLLLL